MKHPPHAVVLWLSVMAAIFAVSLVLKPFDIQETRRQYTDFLPPDTVHWRSPVVDSITVSVALCFKKHVPPGWNWYLSDSALGYGEDNEGHRGRAVAKVFFRDKSVVVQSRATNPTVVNHEARHLVNNVAVHPPGIFRKECP